MRQTLLMKSIILVFLSLVILPISSGYSLDEYSTNNLETINVFKYHDEVWSSIAQWEEPGSQYELTSLKISGTDFLKDIHATWIHNDSKLYLGHCDGVNWDITPTFIELEPFNSLDYAFNMDEKGSDHLWWMENDNTVAYTNFNGSKWSKKITLDIPVTSIHDSYLSRGEVMYLIDSTTLWIGNGSSTLRIIDKGFDYYLKRIIITDSDQIHLFFTTRSHEDDFNILSIQSLDGGKTWTNQELIINASVVSPIAKYHVLSTDFTHPIVARDEAKGIYLFHKVDRTWESDTFSEDAISEHNVFYSYYNGTLWAPQLSLSLPENLLTIDIEHVIVGPGENVHLFWIARFEGTYLWELIHDIISKNGTLIKRNHVMSSQNDLSNVHSVIDDSGVLQVIVVDILYQSYYAENIIPGFELELATSSGFMMLFLVRKSGTIRIIRKKKDN
ncbi:MAG: hypothetical protein ACFFB5_24865 [Promethearchaeota archaeon]